MEFIAYLTCAGDDCQAQAQVRVSDLSVMNATPLAEHLRAHWPDGWMMRRQFGDEQVFCPACQRDGKVPPPPKSRPYKPLA